MVSLRRWHTAQEYERGFWEHLALRIQSGVEPQLDWYDWKAAQLDKSLSRFLDERAKKEAKILEIGSGPLGIVNSLRWAERFAIDPLEEFYRQDRTLTKLRNPEVTRLKGVGEHPPFEDGSFAVVILDNVIDHTHAPHAVLQQIHRILHEDGLLYLAVNIHTVWGAGLHSLLAALRADRGHPHTFNRTSIECLLRDERFAICEVQTDSYADARERNRRSQQLKGKIKAYTGATEFEFRAVARKARAISVEEG